MRIGVLTISDGCAAGVRKDESGALIEAWCAERGYSVGRRAVVRDERAEIVRHLLEWADHDPVEAIITTGGTGLTARDVTPEATRAVIDREAPGISEEIRRRGATSTLFAALSRGVSGTRGQTLIVNLPGSQGGVKDGLDVLSEVIDHAVELATGAKTDHGSEDEA